MAAIAFRTGTERGLTIHLTRRCMHLARSLATAALGSATVLGVNQSAHAAHGPRIVALSDFFDVCPSEVDDVSDRPAAIVAGIPSNHAIEVDRGIASLAYNTHRYPGYSALRVTVGLSHADGGSQNVLLIRADGHRLREVIAVQGQSAKTWTFHFGDVQVLHVAVHGDDPATSGRILASPTLLK